MSVFLGKVTESTVPKNPTDYYEIEWKQVLGVPLKEHIHGDGNVHYEREEDGKILSFWFDGTVTWDDHDIAIGAWQTFSFPANNASIITAIRRQDEHDSYHHRVWWFERFAGVGHE